MAVVSGQAAVVAAPTRATRYQTARSTLFVDRLMTWLITAGGVGIIIAVMGIFVFIGSQILPLFYGASVKLAGSLQIERDDYALFGLDEWSELPFFVTRGGEVKFVNAATGQVVARAPIDSTGRQTITAWSFNPTESELIVGTADGSFAVAGIDYHASFAGSQRTIEGDVRAGKFLQIGPLGSKVREIAYGDSGTDKLAAAIVQVGGKREVHAVQLEQSQSLMGSGEITIGSATDLTDLIVGEPQRILVPADAESIIITTSAGKVFYIWAANMTERQIFEPFADQADKAIASADFVFGDTSVVFTNPAGVNRIFSLFVPEGGDQRLFGQTKEFDSLPGGASFYAHRLRNKGFLIGSGSSASLRYATTGVESWSQDLGFTPIAAAISGKDDRIALLDADSKLHWLDLHDPHPEAGWNAFFGKVWYEGYSEPKYEWQSTGGTDDFESKFSLVPLIFGTLKGTVYAMLFALPIALMAAMYTSQFAHPKVRTVVKPTMEIMASLPSVVLGFLAALWLAPLLENRVPSILLIVFLVPLAAFLLGYLWERLPWGFRQWVPHGTELATLIVVTILVGVGCWSLGPIVEQWLFVVTDPSTGKQVADFRLWWPQFTDTDFQQRNSLVVGFIMGFAVIPIIFTITEDALSNVPASLRSGALALGASRWQTAISIVLPTASAGIFSALMVGLGRAVGETMIVLMATGNTPIMEWNIFSGMRTLSANIATELPEAPHHSTLFRTLFLGAMVLFLMTFVVNTIAEVLRQRLRRKFRTA